VTTALDRPRETDSRWRRVQAPALAAGAVLGASLLLHVRDPHQSGSYLYCPWLLLTGTYCPGCGGLRAVNDLSNGDLRSAFSSNALFVGSIPLLLWWWGTWAARRWRGVRRAPNPRLAYAGTAVLVVLTATFWVVRNLDAGAWLAP
jgi:hypothetical protein